VPVSLAAAALAFVAGLGLAFWLARSGRERTGFAALVAAPMLAALAFAATTAPVSGTAAAAVVAPAPAGHAAAAEADRLRSTADELRAARRFGEARDAFRQLVEASPGDVDAWADLADAEAAAANGDLAPAGVAIDRALAIDPNHLKALWLKASLEFQQKRFDAATGLWERLLAQLPPASNDARVVRANLDETRALAAQQGARR
jgi:cytochrome c-type biogenesis protein CcmH